MACSRSCSTGTGPRCQAHAQSPSRLPRHLRLLRPTDLRPRELGYVRCDSQVIQHSQPLTEVVSALCDHAAVNLPQPVASIDKLEGVRDNLILVLGRDIL
jgi:hypothetical protein